MTQTISRAAFYVGKGGVGKTTSAAHIATSASLNHDLNVVLLDLAGTQNDLATQFGMFNEVADPDAPVSAVFGEDWEFISENIPDIVDRMVFETDEGPDLIPADNGITGADTNLSSVPVEERYLRLDSFISDHLADRYDLVVFDLPGKEDNISLNGILAAERIIAPLMPGSFERHQLDTLRSDLESIRSDLQDVLEPKNLHPRVEMIIPTMISSRTTQSAEFVDELDAEFGNLVGEEIPKTQNIPNLQDEGKTLFAADADELYVTGQRALEAYRQNTEQILERLTLR